MSPNHLTWSSSKHPFTQSFRGGVAVRDPILNTETTTEVADLPRLAYSIDEFARMFGISRSAVFDLLKSGEVRRSKILTRTVIHASEVRRFAACLTDDAA
ncbi:helix-turn-helix domain-containing protein [Mesorhizobium sp. KR1-2]|uniref:helix-turn-helix domain-containing protein n=1 Tax=Mesorhizobium sp. KR1-2 TaxID=3156609 RepID=UPI0032B58396